MRLWRRVAAALVVVGLSVVLAACGSDDKKSSTGSNDTGSKPPVKLFGIIDVTTPPGTNSQVDMYRMAVDAMNADGGIDGRKIDFEICDSQTNPNATISCARKAIAARAPGVISYAVNGGTYVEVLEKAGIPVIGPGLFGAAEFSNRMSFPVLGGGIAAVAGYAAVAKQADCTSVSYVADAPPAYAAVIQQTVAIFEGKARALGLKTNRVILATPASPDFSSYIKSADAQGSDCLILQPIPSDLVAMIKAAKQTTKSKLIVANGQFDAASVKTLGDDLLDGIWVDDIAWPIEAADGHAGVEQYVSDLKEFNPKGVAGAGTPDMVGWTAVHLFAHAIRNAKSDSAADVLAALNATHDYDPGVAPPLSFDEPASRSQLVPRLFMNAVVVGRYNGSRVEPIGFFDMSSGESVDFPSQLSE